MFFTSIFNSIILSPFNFAIGNYFNCRSIKKAFESICSATCKASKQRSKAYKSLFRGSSIACKA